MNQTFRGWHEVASLLTNFADSPDFALSDGQAASLRALATRLPDNGVIIADEVGMGKTRIAATVARSVIQAGGRVAILVPPGLGDQWNVELKTVKVNAPLILRSLKQYFQAWGKKEGPSPWFRESALVISHSFTNWRLGKPATAWRWALLPEIYARWQKKCPGGRWPRDYCSNEKLRDEGQEYKWLKTSAEHIVSALFATSKTSEAHKFIEELANAKIWPQALDAEAYGRDTELRPWLERSVGLGLGVFDLVVIDEAHKSRGQDSGLNRLLAGVILPSSQARHMAMTATPVELEVAQWTQMLERIHVDEASRSLASQAIADYAKSVDLVRKCPSNSEARDKFKASASAFECALDRYLLRRDKREDPSVIKFQEVSGQNHHAYREEREIPICTPALSTEWKQTVCAAEALSFVTSQADDPIAKRLRLTLGNGHGISSLIDQLHDDRQEKQEDADADTSVANIPEQESTTKSALEKRRGRAAWWQQILIRPFDRNENSALFDHPAILAAIEEIETVCRQGEKVLVFGRFTRPLRALVQLLNAREMLRCLAEHRPWPQTKVSTDEEWAAIVSARRQLHLTDELTREALNSVLTKQYQMLENQRRNIRDKLLSHIAKGLEDLQPAQRVLGLFEHFRHAIEEDLDQTQNGDDKILSIMTRALQELIGAATDNATPADYAQAFIDLAASAEDQDESDPTANDQAIETEITDLWLVLRNWLHEEYNRPEGRYARLMHGETPLPTRRFLQLAFNRRQSRPRVLVAQSMVGREGLNLHKSCRTVVLLHPEWNPGVVEQQIGRVDRIGSFWEQKLKMAVANKQTPDDIPKIQVRPVVFRGTYDEANWQVLQERWDDLRAQLHGIVISPGVAAKYPQTQAMIDNINHAAPDFSPSRKN